ncbi:hypothetical protein SKTS_20010 [Sulfurimicrobium lacus]|uniref:Uncharacterized protein n=1 Tax=Sulfurimicrobium lacus TaxID=2715678 RepID=A0A6F8VEC9_9PROT|nr:hypothetical protein SKTS_20010 [Sulfurimicrobium lacus]
MSTSRNKFVLLLLLALLQCFAPLLHAHTHGIGGASGVHLDGVDELVVADSGKPAFMADRSDAPAIAMVQEYRQNRSISLHADDQPALAASALSFSTVFFQLPFLAPSVVTTLPGGPLIYSRPFSQAPPAALI